jgi:hypothetical protein
MFLIQISTGTSVASLRYFVTSFRTSRPTAGGVPLLNHESFLPNHF